MSEKDFNEEQEKCNADDCCCDEPEKAQQEYADAVDESDPSEAEAATDELTKWRELAMRTAAEYDNYRKRCVKEREEFCRYANRGLLEELLPVIDQQLLLHDGLLRRSDASFSYHMVYSRLSILPCVDLC